jgi:hypothetical protein
MEPLLLVLIPGMLGGIVLALFIARIRARGHAHPERPLAPPSPGMINMAHIRIEGIGGLGMVAMAATVAIGEPRIRLAMAIALAVGVSLAALLIAWRRRTGPYPSGNDPGAHDLFPLDGKSPPSSGHDPRRAGNPSPPRIRAAVC